MCYRKPGPRCSAHARAEWVKARHRYLDTDFVDAFDKKAAMDEAEKQFYMTPAGFRELERLIGLGKPTESRRDAKVELEYAQEARRLALEEIKAVDQGDVEHDAKKPSNSVSSKVANPAEFVDDPNVERYGWDTFSAVERQKAISNYVDDSASWVDSLPPEEISAVRWLTSAGSVEAAHYLNGEDMPSYNRDEEPEEQLERVKQTITELDSALSKYEGEERIIYRGANDFVASPEMRENRWKADYDTHKEEYLASLTPGTEMVFESYQSATLDPAVAMNFQKHDIILEMKTRRGAPVGVASAWYASEREVALPRGMKFRVVKVIRDVEYVNKSTYENREKALTNSNWDIPNPVVIQLEEV